MGDQISATGKTMPKYHGPVVHYRDPSIPIVKPKLTDSLPSTSSLRMEGAETISTIFDGIVTTPNGTEVAFGRANPQDVSDASPVLPSPPKPKFTSPGENVEIPSNLKPMMIIKNEWGNTKVYNMKNKDGTSTYFVKNDSETPMEVGIAFLKRGENPGEGTFNIRADKDIPVVNSQADASKDHLAISVPPHEAREAFTVGRGSNQAWGVYPTFLPRVGFSKNKHDDLVKYQIPFADGFSWEVSQGENDKDGTHIPGSHNEFALDLVTNDPQKRVFAINDGVIVKAKEDSDEGGPDVSPSKANEVWVLHKDGSIAKYVHLAQNSVTNAGVKVGDSVRRGQLIGNYGLTGNATAPHLHLQVDLPKGMKGNEHISISNRFVGPNGLPIGQKLTEGVEFKPSSR